MAFLTGLAVGYRLGNAVAYWYIRARGHRAQAEALRRLARSMRATKRAGERIRSEGLAGKKGARARDRRLQIVLEETSR
jgi:hypothetical protein